MNRRPEMRKWWNHGIVGLGCLMATAVIAENLLPNGSFDDALNGWQYQYERQGESHYFDNHRYVSVVPRENGRGTVLRLNVATQYLADVPGVKVDSHPVPVERGGRYRLSAWARSTGPDLRLYAVGYKWRPGVEPHANPSLYELRKCYNFAPVIFGPVGAGTSAGLVPGAAWKKADGVFPDVDPKELKDLQQKLFNDVQFLVIHVIGIKGRAGDVFVDDLVLERLN